MYLYVRWVSYRYHIVVSFLSKLIDLPFAKVFKSFTFNVIIDIVEHVDFCFLFAPSVVGPHYSSVSTFFSTNYYFLLFFI